MSRMYSVCIVWYVFYSIPDEICIAASVFSDFIQSMTHISDKVNYKQRYVKQEKFKLFSFTSTNTPYLQSVEQLLNFHRHFTLSHH